MLREELNSGLTLMERRDIIITMVDILKKGESTFRYTDGIYISSSV